MNVCIYNDGCECPVRSRDKCNGCGWNPREARRRKQYDPLPEIDEDKAREFLEEKEIQRYAELSQYEKQTKLCPLEKVSSRAEVKELLKQL